MANSNINTQCTERGVIVVKSKMMVRTLAFLLMLCMALPAMAEGALPMEDGVVITEGAEQMLGYEMDPIAHVRVAEPSEVEIAVLNTNWLIANLGTDEEPEYYKLAELTLPEGYYRSHNTSKKDQETDFFFYPESKQIKLSYVYVAGVQGKYSTVSKQTANQVATYANNARTQVSAIKYAPIGTSSAYYYTYTMLDTYEADKPQYIQSMCCYFPAKNDSTVVLLLTILAHSESDYLADEELLELAREVAQNLVIEL